VQAPRNAPVQVRFDEPIQATSLDAVRLLANGSPIAVALALADGNRTLTLTPAALLAASTSYPVSLGGVRDTAGNLLAGTTETAFSTSTSVDFVRPSATGFVPVDGTIDVPTTTSVQVTFDEPINPLSLFVPGSVRLFVTNTGEMVDTSVDFSPDYRTVILTPPQPLASATLYTIEASFETTDQASNRLIFAIRSSFSTQ
jgi:hypothetical protein